MRKWLEEMLKIYTIKINEITDNEKMKIYYSGMKDAFKMMLLHYMRDYNKS